MHRRMVWVGVVVLVLVLAAALYASQTPQAARGRAEVGRYQLVVYSNTLCKMDTSTGQIWVMTSGMERQLGSFFRGMNIQPEWRDLDELYKSLGQEAD